MNRIIFEDDTWFDKFLDFINWYRFKNLFKNWIYPAYDLKNLLFYRYDRIKIPQVKPWEYTDIMHFMLCANMEMIVNFMEKEHPEKYVLWYKDKDGNDVGHKYGEYNTKIMFPELKDKWIMDLIKEIYNWWKVDYKKIQDEYDYLLEFYCDYIIGDVIFSKADENNLCECNFDKTKNPKTIKDFENLKNVKWEIINKYINNDKEILLNDERFSNEVLKKLEIKIFEQKQYYLHLCIEVRPYLWT